MQTKQTQLTTPVACFIFNRPKLTEMVFAAIAAAKPRKLMVVADGPRYPEETEACRETRAVVERIDWECDLRIDAADTNMGCKQRISSGLDWVFSEVDEAIILEDDCLPAPSFFYFCETLLVRYRRDERVMMISGDNFQHGQQRTAHSYYFSKYTSIWGWATWRRAWKHYDVNMTSWPEFKQSGLLRGVCEDPDERAYWTRLFDLTHAGAIDTWDYQWCYACWSQGSLAILPNCNLVSNIGFGERATHVFDGAGRAALPVENIWAIEDPPFVVQDREADLYTFEYLLGGRKTKQSSRPLSQAWTSLASMRKKFAIR